MELYMIRHGETEWNRIRRLQGQTDIPLNDTGRELAVRVGHQLRDIPFSMVISSPLQRAVETATLVITAAGREIEIRRDDRLKEIAFGVYEGYSVVNSQYTAPDPDFHNFFDAPQLYHAPQKGENFSQLLERTGAFLKELAANRDYEQDTILLSVHGAVMRALLANIKGLGVEQFWDTGVPQNCAVAIARTHQGQWVLEAQDLLLEDLERLHCASMQPEYL